MKNLLGGKKEKLSHHEQVRKENVAKAEFDEQVEERSLSMDVYSKLLKNSIEWRHIELVACIFSVLGLLIAMIEYEVELDSDGYRGFLLIHDNSKNT